MGFYVNQMKIKCPHCEYEWETKAKLNSVTCPNCQKKFFKTKVKGGQKT